MTFLSKVNCCCQRLQLSRSHRLLQRWFASASNNDSSKYRKESLPADYKGQVSGVDFEDVFSSPVRNTEKEYYETHLNPEWEGHKKSFMESRFYSKKHGVSTELMSWLQWELNVNDDQELSALVKKAEFEKLKQDQRYLQERTDAVGYELGAAHFLVTRGACVKFVDRDTWFKKIDGQYSLPRFRMENLYLEAIDASNMDLTYVSFDTLGHLSQLRYLKLHNCPHIDDECLARLRRLQNSLEFLDIQDCPNVTDCGLTSLHHLHKLQGLRLSNLKSVQNLGLLALLLEEKHEGLKILGLRDEDMKPPEHDHRGEARLVRALLGLTKGDEMEERGEEKQISKTKNDDLKRYRRKFQ